MRRAARIASAGSVAVAAALWVRSVVVPARPDDVAPPRPRPLPLDERRPSPDGAGVRIVVNPSSGPAWRPAATEDLRTALPAADVHELASGDDLTELLCDERYGVIGAAGGDGTLGAAAVVAADRDATLVAVPGGTLNHLSRDLGLDSVDDAVAAVRAGTAVCIDLGTVGDRCFVNTLTLGGYGAIVDARERLEGRIGKWPALAVALVRELPRMQPVRLRVDGEPVELWLGWIGNGRYEPRGLAPVWREHLDDGVLDVRLLRAGQRWARTRFVLAALSGRLRSLDCYSERTVESLEIECLDGPPRLATDGETFDGPERFTVAKRTSAVRVAVPPQD